MAFPGELNINYYKGDTYEFKIYPQKTDGSIFSLNDYSNATFTIAESRGPSSVNNQHIFGHASIEGSGTYILCAITPDNGEDMDSPTTYVYDVQIYAQGSGTYDKVLTLLTGSISVTDDISQNIGNTNRAIPTYRVIYYNTNATGGQVPIDETKYVTNQDPVVKNNETLVREGFTFSGWNTAADGLGVNYASGSTILNINADVKLYPKWTAV
jgi:uncharacterized repeat protein (TIGR02543 family)